MNQLTIRGVDDALRRKIRDLARREHLSLSEAALELMRRGAGLRADKPLQNVNGTALDDFIGTWSVERERDLAEAVAPFEAVDRGF